MWLIRKWRLRLFRICSDSCGSFVHAACLRVGTFLHHMNVVVQGDQFRWFGGILWGGWKRLLLLGLWRREQAQMTTAMTRLASVCLLLDEHELVPPLLYRRMARCSRLFVTNREGLLGQLFLDILLRVLRGWFARTYQYLCPRLAINWLVLQLRAAKILRGKLLLAKCRLQFTFVL